MNYVILGAGAIGCYLGARLAAAGQQVTLIGRPKIIDTIARDGLTVTDLDAFKAQVHPDKMRLATTVDADMFTSPTVVLLCVKGGGTVSAVQELATVCPAHTMVLSMQNGVDNVARIATAAPQLSAVAGMVPFNVVMLKANHVHRGTTGPLQLGRNPTTEQIRPALIAAGLPVELSDDMRPIQWGKLLLNLNNPVNALSDMPLRAQLMNRDYRRVVAAMQLEALAAMKAAGIHPDKVATAPPHVLPYILRLPNWLFKRVAARMLRMDENARSSMWDDVQQGRTTEIDDLCGAAVRLAAQVGVPTPVNTKMCELLASHHAGQRMSGPELLRATGL